MHITPTLLVLAALALCALPAEAKSKTPPRQRIAFIGDSITDGSTYPLMVQQALRDAGQPEPVIIVAGIGGDTAKGMSGRLDRDVLPYRPTLVTLSAGVNDASHKVSLEDYAASITSIANRLRDEKIPLVIMTTTIFGARLVETERRADEYNAWLRAFTKERGLKLAEVNGLFKTTRAEKGEAFMMEADAVHVNWEGQRLIASAVVDALGYPNAVVPLTLAPDLLPGVITSWRMRALPDNKMLDAAAVQAITPETAAAWKEITLPETEPPRAPWLEHERRRGFGLSLNKTVGEGKLFQGVAVVTNPETKPKPVFFNTGAQLQTIWLNGERIYQNTEWHGWHAGRDRIAASLKPGPNTVFIETHSEFFLSITDTNQW